MANYLGATERDLLDEISLAQIRIAREQKRIAEAEEALATLKSSNGGESKRESTPAK